MRLNHGRLLALSFLLPMLMGFKTGFHGSVEIDYGFEHNDLESGPDTFELFETETSDISVSSQFAFRGGRSLHVRDLDNNQDFPEFQGYFPLVRDGVVRVGFALMSPNPKETFNVALAGEQHFSMAKDGFGFWLINDAGLLRHMSDGIPKRLIELVAYQWYWFEIELNLDDGVYSLQIENEFGEQLISLAQQAHPSSKAQSNLNMYSFIGDLQDRSQANFYIDEFKLETDYADSPQPLKAPGRRSLFVEKWNQYYKKIEKLRYCLPTRLPYDFVIPENLLGLEALQEESDTLRQLLAKPTTKFLAEFEHENPLIKGISKWALGCRHLQNGEHSAAIKNLLRAQELVGTTPATQLSLALAYAKSGKIYPAYSILNYGETRWADDVRWPVLRAAIGFIGNSAADSEYALASLAQALEYDRIKSELVLANMRWTTVSAANMLSQQQVWDEDVEKFVIAEQYYFSLLWQQKFSAAERFAQEFIGLLSRFKIQSSLWAERAGDAAFFSGDYRAAEQQYNKALGPKGSALSIRQKLADVYFMQGRMEKEREVRESIFGALDYQ